MLFFIIDRRSKRSCCLSVVKSTPDIEVKEDKQPIVDDNEFNTEDPPELYQLGDILWVHVSGNPWWPALIYGIHSKS